MARTCSNDECPDYLATGTRQEFMESVSFCTACGESLEAEAPLEPAEEVALDPAQIAFLEQQLSAEQNLPLAILGGGVAALASAGIWAGITASTGYQIGFMAIGVGFVVGFAVRALGKGISSPFGVIGAISSLVGCALGNLFAVTQIVAGNEGVPFIEALPQLTLPMAQELMVAFFTPMDLLFYAIAIYYGYSLSFRQISGDELQSKLGGVSGA